MPDAPTRETIIDALHGALRALPAARALWEAGSHAFGRDDSFSDIDLVTLVDDGCADEAVAAVDAALTRLAPIEIRWAVPHPTWHGHDQVFYRLAGTSPFLIVDMLFQQRSNEQRFLEPERHGVAGVIFDDLGIVVPAPFDRQGHAARVGQRIQELATRWRLFEPFVEKEVRRDNPLGALAAHGAFTLAPLNELLRIAHCPDRFEYGLRYARCDLPPAIVKELERIAYVADMSQVMTARNRADTLFQETLEALAGPAS